MKTHKFCPLNLYGLWLPGPSHPFYPVSHFSLVRTPVHKPTLPIPSSEIFFNWFFFLPSNMSDLSHVRERESLGSNPGLKIQAE